eukprot:SAG31_NODE_20931_length_561_cov_4.729437_1_plen_64_part_10
MQRAQPARAHSIVASSRAAARANAQMQPPLLMWAALLGLSAASAQSTSGGAADARRQHNVLYFV